VLNIPEPPTLSVAVNDTVTEAKYDEL